MGSNKNSFTESLANFFTPNDGYSYSGGTLREDTPEGKGMGAAYTGGSYATNYGQFGQADSAGTGTNYQNVTSGGEARNTGSGYTPPKIIAPPPEAKNTGPMYTNPLIMGTIGAFSGGLPGLLLGAGSAKIRGGMYNVPQIDNTQGNDPKLVSGRAGASGYKLKKREVPNVTTEDIKQQLENDRRGIETKNRIEGAFYKDGDESKLFKLNRFGSSYEVDGYGHPNYGNSKQNRLDMEAGSDGSGGIAMVRSPAPITQATVPTGGLPAASAESEFAKQQIESPPVEWLIANGYPDTNPSYEAIRKYNTELRSGVASMAEGGDVEFALGGNEKDLINAMENVVRKDLADDGEFNPANISDEDKIVIAQFVQQYGVDAIPRLVKKIQDGSIDETRERFARGENGVVRGNGDGSGVDDMVTAQLKDGDATQDVLLADGEFVLRKDAYEALKDAGVNVDKVNDAGSNAAKELNKMMTA
jgi:hypothetical protein